SGELEERVEKLYEMLRACTVCPRDCGNDRLAGVLASCASGADPVVSAHTPHFGEEPFLSGTRGAGNVFFGNCNLRCVYCQNWQISQSYAAQLPNTISVERLAEMLLSLQSRGCHNIGFVSPTHYAPQMAKAILLAARAGLTLPIVYNTNCYDSVEVLRLLEGVVDVYLPDLKYADDAAGSLYSKVPDYPARARDALLEMYRQKGARLELHEEDGLLKSGLIVRLLVLPNGVAGVRDTLTWIAETLSPRVAISLMAQYYPIHRAAADGRYGALDRSITPAEWEEARAALADLGFENGFEQVLETSNRYYRPDFNDPVTPFKDIRDFGSAPAKPDRGSTLDTAPAAVRH
ncbi:MAG TPA: radical SAM protein, partial [Thermoanaerobaculia bacterium]|nr:radical SAM protein [Thermoanaerobaculia bacterium]